MRRIEARRKNAKAFRLPPLASFNDAFESKVFAEGMDPTNRGMQGNGVRVVDAQSDVIAVIVVTVFWQPKPLATAGGVPPSYRLHQQAKGSYAK